jgi:adenosylmethionine---8-amino-7-oxononanoate aminotransferase
MTSPDIAELLAFDREHLWHPYTSMVDPVPTRLVTGANGVRLHLADGRDVIDAMSSWWAAIHGYNHPVLNAAATDQLSNFAHVMFGGLTHEPAIRLAQQLIAITPVGLDHVFLADSGSVSVEVAMKMVLQHQRGIGRPERTRFLTVGGGYHGDTFNAMSICDPRGGMHAMYAGVLPNQVFGEKPPVAGSDISEWEQGFRQLADQHTQEVAGLIVEPLLQGAGGMHIYPAACLKVFREVADEHGFSLIFDEIATGFGRTGTMFAAEAGPVTPDVMCVGKALTGGYLSLAAVLCTTSIAEGLSRSEAGVLMHGPTYMGNPLSCAIASASIDLLLQQDWQGAISRINRGLVAALPTGRTIGAVGVLQLDHPVQVAKATEIALDYGVWLRPFRNLIYTMPPYLCTDAEIAVIGAAMHAAAEVG